MKSIITKINNINFTKNINNLPNDILFEIFNKCDTSSILNINKTNKLFNKLISNDIKQNKIQELESELFQLELVFYLKINKKNYFKLQSGLNNIKNYIKLFSVKYDWIVPDLQNPVFYNNLVKFNLRINIITYDIIQVKHSFNSFLKDYDLYNILMTSDKEYELLTYITKEQDKLITEYKKNNIRFKFNGIGNKDEFERIYRIMSEDVNIIDLRSLNNLKWLNIECVISNKNIIKNLIGLNLDLTVI
jgi:hypothetical protein